MRWDQVWRGGGEGRGWTAKHCSNWLRSQAIAALFSPLSLHNVAITLSKARSTFASVRPPKSAPTKPTGATREGGGGETQPATAAAAAAARPTPAAALRRLAVAHFPQMTWDKATNLAAVARGGACAASGRGLIQRTYSSNGLGGGGEPGQLYRGCA